MASGWRPRSTKVWEWGRAKSTDRLFGSLIYNRRSCSIESTEDRFRRLGACAVPVQVAPIAAGPSRRFWSPGYAAPGCVDGQRLDFKARCGRGGAPWASRRVRADRPTRAATDAGASADGTEVQRARMSPRGTDIERRQVARQAVQYVLPGPGRLGMAQHQLLARAARTKHIRYQPIGRKSPPPITLPPRAVARQRPRFVICLRKAVDVVRRPIGGGIGVLAAQGVTSRKGRPVSELA